MSNQWCDIKYLFIFWFCFFKWTLRKKRKHFFARKTSWFWEYCLHSLQDLREGKLTFQLIYLYVITFVWTDSFSHKSLLLQSWGTMMNYRSIECPCLLVKNFVVTLNGKKIPNCTRWADLPVKFPSFDYSEYAMRLAEGSDDEDTEWSRQTMIRRNWAWLEKDSADTLGYY